jgi:hypothetical protein
MCDVFIATTVTRRARSLTTSLVLFLRFLQIRHCLFMSYFHGLLLPLLTVLVDRNSSL